jgi:hypothetical protein
MFISLVADFTMLNPEFAWGAQAYSTISPARQPKFTVRLVGQNRFSRTHIDLAVFKLGFL